MGGGRFPDPSLFFQGLEGYNMQWSNGDWRPPKGVTRKSPHPKIFNPQFLDNSLTDFNKILQDGRGPFLLSTKEVSRNSTVRKSHDPEK